MRRLIRSLFPRFLLPYELFSAFFWQKILLRHLSSLFGLIGFHFACLILIPSLALATQTHGEPEGLFVHQAAHLFFVISMGIFAYRLNAGELTNLEGWRLIWIAAVLLIVWNIDAALVHFLDEQLYALQIKNIDYLHIQLITNDGYEFLGLFYYILKLDHLWCVPALVFLYLGLRKLSKEIEPTEQKKERS